MIDYQDTDATGVVYHGQYLALMERARNACLRALDLPVSQLAEKTGVIFAMARAELDFRLPARLDDEVDVSIDRLTAGGARLVFAQCISRGAEKLVEGQLTLVTLNAKTFRPCKIPANLNQAIERFDKLT